MARVSNPFLIDRPNDLCIFWVMNPIAAARFQLDLSQEELAKLLGVNQATVSRMEGGQTAIGRRTILALKQILADALARR